VLILIHHVALKHLFKTSDYKLCLIRWVLLLQGFNLEVHDEAGLENVVVDHFPHLGLDATLIKELLIDDSFPSDQLLVISHQATLWYANLVNFLRDCYINQRRNS